MYKVVWLCQFNKDLTFDEARRYWREVHGPIALKVPGMLGYKQNHCTQPVEARNLTPEQLAFDGYAEAWWADEASYDAAMNSPEWAALLEDGAILFNTTTMSGAALDEHVMRELPKTD